MKGKGYGSERMSGGSAKAGQQKASASAIGDGRQPGLGGLGSGQKPEAAGSSAMVVKNGVAR